jgi:phosphatidylinositol-bisphosphatase
VPLLAIQVLEKHLVGIMLVVFVKDKHRAATYDVYGSTVGVGILGMAGNKGGASIRFTFYDSHLCFGNTHGIYTDICTIH